MKLQEILNIVREDQLENNIDLDWLFEQIDLHGYYFHYPQEKLQLKKYILVEHKDGSYEAGMYAYKFKGEWVGVETRTYGKDRGTLKVIDLEAGLKLKDYLLSLIPDEQWSFNKMSLDTDVPDYKVSFPSDLVQYTHVNYNNQSCKIIALLNKTVKLLYNGKEVEVEPSEIIIPFNSKYRK